MMMPDAGWSDSEYWELYPAMAAGLGSWHHRFIKLMKTHYLETIAYQGGVIRVAGVRDTPRRPAQQGAACAVVLDGAVASGFSEPARRGPPLPRRSRGKNLTAISQQRSKWPLWYDVTFRAGETSRLLPLPLALSQTPGERYE